MDIIEIYTNEVSALLGIDVIFQVDYLNGSLPNWNTLKIGHLFYIKDMNIVKFRLIHDFEGNEIISQFGLIQMPGCCGICISTGVGVCANYRRKGLNKLLNQMRINIAKFLGYGILMCTDVIANTAERKTLEANGWKPIYGFKNPRTNNLLHVTIKEL
jgi:hypothetical protein